VFGAREFRPRGFPFFHLSELVFDVYSLEIFLIFFGENLVTSMLGIRVVEFLLCGWPQIFFCLEPIQPFKKFNSSPVPDGAYPDNI
jgi:hypothetical protein